MAGFDCSATQFIDGNGIFNDGMLKEFIQATNFADCGIDYAIVSIMGPQSSGKSTLMNHLFGTSFKEMDAAQRRQTTKGIWIAKCNETKPFTIAIDIEGTDGDQREDDTTFEKQSSLFALAISDIVMINMWCHDIGREKAANKPLLRTIFQVILRLFKPHKTTLLFVIRDKTKTPLDSLKSALKGKIDQIWNEIPKPEDRKHTSLSESFIVEVVALPNYEEKEDKFKEEVSQLRELFFHSTKLKCLASGRCDILPASDFSTHTQKIWKVIRENKDLNLPAEKKMVAIVRCEEIANEKLSDLQSNEDWLELHKAVESGLAEGFGQKLSSIINAYLKQYDEETIFYDKAVTDAKRKSFLSNILDFVYPTYKTMLQHLYSKALQDFKTKLVQSPSNKNKFTSSVSTLTESIMDEFDKGIADVTPKQANWDGSKMREKLHCDITSHVSSIEENYKRKKEQIIKLIKLGIKLASVASTSIVTTVVPDQSESVVIGKIITQITEGADHLVDIGGIITKVMEGADISIDHLEEAVPIFTKVMEVIHQIIEQVNTL